MPMFKTELPRGQDRGGRRGAFTLVELLVVIGIIALLISILLPSLQGARRSANSIKCQAALRSIGQAFVMYGNDFKGAWPAARDHRDTNSANWHRWTDLVTPYISGKKDIKNYTDIADLRQRSVLWGCPEWTKAYDYSASSNAAAAVNVYNGYGMQYYPDYFQPNGGTNAANLANTTNPKANPYIKANVWQRKGAERGLIADAQWDIIWLSNNPYTAVTKFQPYDPAAFVAPGITVDARHAKPGSSKQMAANNKSLNMLFCDGHVSPVTPGEAQRAIRSPGMDKLPGDP